MVWGLGSMCLGFTCLQLIGLGAHSLAFWDPGPESPKPWTPKC